MNWIIPLRTIDGHKVFVTSNGFISTHTREHWRRILGVSSSTHNENLVVVNVPTLGGMESIILKFEFSDICKMFVDYVLGKNLNV